MQAMTWVLRARCRERVQCCTLTSSAWFCTHVSQAHVSLYFTYFIKTARTARRQPFCTRSRPKLFCITSKIVDKTEFVCAMPSAPTRVDRYGRPYMEHEVGSNDATRHSVLYACVFSMRSGRGRARDAHATLSSMAFVFGPCCFLRDFRE